MYDVCSEASGGAFLCSSQLSPLKFLAARRLAAPSWLQRTFMAPKFRVPLCRCLLFLAPCVFEDGATASVHFYTLFAIYLDQ